MGTIAPTAQREWGGMYWYVLGCATLVSPCPLPGCSTYMDIILVLDGSNSIYPWEEVQAFLGNILGRFFIGPGQTQVRAWHLGHHDVPKAGIVSPGQGDCLQGNAVAPGVMPALG